MSYRPEHNERRGRVRELRQNLSRYLARVKAGESLTVTEHGREVARLVPSGAEDAPYWRFAESLGATVPSRRLEDVAAELPRSGMPAGTTDAWLAGSRADKLA